MRDDPAVAVFAVQRDLHSAEILRKQIPCQRADVLAEFDVGNIDNFFSGIVLEGCPVFVLFGAEIKKAFHIPDGIKRRTGKIHIHFPFTRELLMGLDVVDNVLDFLELHDGILLILSGSFILTCLL